MSEQIDNALSSIYGEFKTIARHGGYRERKEALKALDAMMWFDNFGEQHYHHRMRAAMHCAEDLKDEDIPEHMEEVRD